MRLRLCTLGIAALILSGCMVGPDYVAPEAEVNESWIPDDPRVRTEPVDDILWWRSFDDPVLDPDFICHVIGHLQLPIGNAR